MNMRKNIDYSEMYVAIDNAMDKKLSQMELYCTIGKAVSARSEKGAAVMAAEYITNRYPDSHGFSPRNLRRMRDFYRTYESEPALLSLTMQISWTQNVVIMEADLTMELREWYIHAVMQFGWSKVELIEKISSRAHKEIVLDIGQEVCDNIDTVKNRSQIMAAVKYIIRKVLRGYLLHQCRGKPKRGGVPWLIMLCPISMGRRIVFMRC